MRLSFYIKFNLVGLIGIEVGRLAGLPPVVISRAKELLKQIDSHSLNYSPDKEEKQERKPKTK